MSKGFFDGFPSLSLCSEARRPPPGAVLGADGSLPRALKGGLARALEGWCSSVKVYAYADKSQYSDLWKEEVSVQDTPEDLIFLLTSYLGY